MRQLFAAMMLLMVCVWAGLAVLSRAEEPSKPAAGKPDRVASTEPPFGISQRVPWTTSKFRGRPEPPPPFRAERIFPRINFKDPTVITSAPGSDRLFVGERTGKVYSFKNEDDPAQAELFVDGVELANRLKELEKRPVEFDSLYGLTFDPQFAENRYCYVCYVVRRREAGRTRDPEGSRVVRMRVTDTDPPRCDMESEQCIITWMQGGHNGGCLKFGPDGCLYISTGDGGEAFPPDGNNTGQDLTDLLSSILRIDVRREESGRPYTIPADNPFVSLEKVRGENWAYGLRNPWKMSFDRQTGDLWVGDVGWELWELVFRVRKGDNYGWSIVEGRQPVHAERQRGPTPIVPPTIEISHVEGASVTGGFVYRGRKFPDLNGQYIFGDWETRRIWGVPVDGEQLGERRELVEPTVRIVDFAEDSQGELYLVDYDTGTIHTLVRNDAKPSDEPFPRKLSETGLFRSVAEHKVADGVLPFSINAEQWSDHALAERFIALPGTRSIALHPKAKQVPGSMFSRAMDFPVDSVVMKTLSLEMLHGDAASRRRIETQVLHYDGRDWRGYSYQWNDGQTDAVLIDAMGKTQTLSVVDPQSPGGRRTQTWLYSSRMECIRCHNPWSEYTLAFNVPQLNRPHDYGSASDNQLRTLRHIGVLSDVVEELDPIDPFAVAVPPKPADRLPRLADPHDMSADVNARGRAYLHVNCAHCHRFNGGGSAHIYLQHDVPLKDVKALGLRPTLGTFGIHDAQIVAAGDPFRSVLYFRLAKSGPGHMPHLGSKIVDERGLTVVHDWIRALPVRAAEVAKIEQLAQLDETAALDRQRDDANRLRREAALRLAKQDQRDAPIEQDYRAAQKQLEDQATSRAKQRAAERAKLIGELLSTPTQAVLLAQEVRHQRLPASIRQLAIDAAMRHADLAIRDVFEPFVPAEQRTQRLGEAIRPEEILKLAGDATRGRQLFQESNVVQCRSCHRIDGKGIELGPDLSQIGKKLDRAKLLDSILQPSLNIEPKYVLWLAETKSGTVVSGLLVQKDEEQVVLKDALNKEHRLPAADVEGLYPQRKA